MNRLAAVTSALKRKGDSVEPKKVPSDNKHRPTPKSPEKQRLVGEPTTPNKADQAPQKQDTEPSSSSNTGEARTGSPPNNTNRSLSSSARKRAVNKFHAELRAMIRKWEGRADTFQNELMYYREKSIYLEEVLRLYHAELHWVNTNGPRKDAMMVESLGREVEKLLTHNESLADEVARLTNELAKVLKEQEVSSQRSAEDLKKFISFAQQHDGVSNRMNEEENIVLKNKVKYLEATLAELHTRDESEASVEVTQLKHKLSELENQVKERNSHLADERGRYEALQRKMLVVEGTKKELADMENAYEGAVSGLKKVISAAHNHEEVMSKLLLRALHGRKNAGSAHELPTAPVTHTDLDRKAMCGHLLDTIRYVDQLLSIQHVHRTVEITEVLECYEDSLNEERKRADELRADGLTNTTKLRQLETNFADQKNMMMVERDACLEERDRATEGLRSLRRHLQRAVPAGSTRNNIDNVFHKIMAQTEAQAKEELRQQKLMAQRSNIANNSSVTLQQGGSAVFRHSPSPDGSELPDTSQGPNRRHTVFRDTSDYFAPPGTEETRFAPVDGTGAFGPPPAMSGNKEGSAQASPNTSPVRRQSSPKVDGRGGIAATLSAMSKRAPVEEGHDATAATHQQSAPQGESAGLNLREQLLRASKQL